MQTRDLGSWGEFDACVTDIRAQYGSFQVGDYVENNEILFRGQADAGWPLLTTLERASAEEFSVQEYMIHASGCVYEIESLTRRKWNVPDYPIIKDEILKEQKSHYLHLPCYDYLVYLRHHGFPSPLLDWTKSPYVAAYFAMWERREVERVAVYAYIERPQGVKSWAGNPPMIRVMGPYVTTHSRHFAQKARYTVAARYHEDSRQHVFCPHGSIFEKGKEHQDVLVKITIPAADRLKALAELDDYNINHFTLFQTEDSLVQALAIRELELGSA